MDPRRHLVRAGVQQDLLDPELASLLHAPRQHALATDLVLIDLAGLEHDHVEPIPGQRRRQRPSPDSAAHDHDVTTQHPDLRFVDPPYRGLYAAAGPPG